MTTGRLSWVGRAILAAVSIAALGAAWAAGAEQAADLKDDPLTSPRTAWFREAKFGMFIHWGIYAVPAGVYKGREIGGIGEWIMNNAKIPVPEYEKFAAEFNPVKFDAKEWARVAKAAGMKYMVITSKHHDGFCMFDTKLTDYCITKATPFKRDPMKELAAACNDAGIRFCFYYSIMDWHNGDQEKNFPAYHDYMKGQVRELLTQYGPIGILWFDGQWIGQWDEAKGRELYAYCRGLQPGLIVNSRVGKGGRRDGDYDNPEQSIPAGAIKGRLWETCMTMNDTWGYKKNDRNWKPAADLVRKLIDITSKGGNFLLNVGPTAEGVIPTESVERLEAVGRWLKTNGDAVYGAAQSPWRRHPFDGRCTVKGSTLYVHVFKWPEGGLSLAGLKGHIRDVSALDKAVGAVKWEARKDGDALALAILAPSAPDPAATVVAVTFKEPVDVDETVAGGAACKQAADGSISLKAADAAIHGDTAQYEADKDCVGFWTRQEDWVGWDAVVTKPGTFAVEVTYACDSGTGGSEFVVAAGDREVAGRIEVTGGWTDFKTVRLGQVAVAKAGRLAVSVKPKSKPGFAVMNLRAVDLKPVKD
jgi:alpha-L-fucosidase